MTTIDVFTYGSQVDELVAIGAAVAANCEPCLDYHVDAARRLGVADADIRRAVATAVRVKEVPARAIRRHADQVLTEPAATEPVPAPDGCCGPAPEAVGS